ncbi:helix-turn-helix domain-containing protein [Streptomyces sp. CAU 1734]|uniref:TetR/AcrR family transcriptional regulator n=1 Tax=Streptomyces sp. CAU 1734 TaxID=3140360 RepID=UPI003260B77C
MGRPRGFDEAEVIRSAVELFACRSYDGISIDDLVTHLGVHRNSLYKTFGSKRGLYLAALRRALEHDVAPLVERMAKTAGPAEALREGLAARGPGLDLLVLATVERAPEDTEVAEIVNRTLGSIDRAAAGGTGAGQEISTALTALLLGLRIRARSAAPGEPDAGRAGETIVRRLLQH